MRLRLLVLLASLPYSIQTKAKATGPQEAGGRGRAGRFLRTAARSSRLCSSVAEGRRRRAKGAVDGASPSSVSLGGRQGHVRRLRGHVHGRLEGGGGGQARGRHASPGPAAAREVEPPHGPGGSGRGAAGGLLHPRTAEGGGAREGGELDEAHQLARGWGSGALCVVTTLAGK